MNKLPKDMINKLIDELSPQDFINFCASETSPNVVRICNIEELWEKRLKKDFSYVLEKFPNFGKANPKPAYIELFSKISKMAETLQKKCYKGFARYDNFYNPNTRIFYILISFLYAIKL